MPGTLNFDIDISSENQFLAEFPEGISVYLKREDLLHPEVSGNKFRKIKYNLKEALNQNKKTILTFGGAFSNHITATAAAGKIAGIKTIGVIRGEELGENLSKTLEGNPSLKSTRYPESFFFFGDYFLLASAGNSKNRNKKQ